MNKRVYLFELDSVRKTDEEVYQGLLAMYDELVGNGNIIVMSMNQITDSRTFLSMLEIPAYYDIIREFFEKGYIKVSRYGTMRTASQYVQNAISKNLESNGEVFIFSALPVKSNQKLLLKLMQKVLVNADLSMLKQYQESGKESEKEILALFNEYQPDGTVRESMISIMTACQYLGILYRFLELTLLVSMYDTSSNPPIKYDEKYQEEDFCGIMHKILSFNDNQDEPLLWKEAIFILENIMKQLESGEENIGKNNRSIWIKRIKQLDRNENKTSSMYAELIVNLCYNYTVEYSIYGVSKHYKRDKGIQSFKIEFFSRLKNDWNKGKGAALKFLQEETNDYIPYNKKDSSNKRYPDWKRGIRIISRRKRYESRSRGNQAIPLYEYSYHKQRRQEKMEDLVNILKGCITAIIYIMGIYVVDRSMSFFQDNVGMLFKSFVTFILLTLVSAIIDKLLPIPNILECIEVITRSLLDFYEITWRRPLAYVNEDNLDTDYMEEKPKLLRQMYVIEDEL